MNKKISSVLQVVVFLAIGILLLWLVLRKQDLSLIATTIKNADLTWAALSLVAALFSNIFRALRWNMLIHPLGYRPKLFNTFSAVMVGYLANMVFPRLGEVSRCGVLNHYEKIPVNKSFGTVVTERIIDVLTILFLFLVLLVFEFKELKVFVYDAIFLPVRLGLQSLMTKGVIYYIIMGSIILIVLGLLWWALRWLRDSAHYQKVRNLFHGFLEGLKTVGQLQHKGLFFLYTILIWFLYLLMSYLCFFSFPETAHLGFMAGLAAMVMGGFGFAAPVPGGIGAFEFMVTGTLIAFGIDKVISDSYAIYIHALQWLGVILFSAACFLLLPVINRKPKS